MRMRPALLVALQVLLLFTSPQLASAQKLYRIGALVANDQFIPVVEGFKKKMAELGYAEGKNIKIEVYNARGDGESLKKMAKKLMQDKPDVIVTSSTTATVPVAKATAGTDIPVVFLSAGNPLAVVKSYARSGNNLTGISTSSVDVTEKRIELLTELAPGIKRVISLNNPRGPNYEANLRATREAANRLGLDLIEVNVTSADELIGQAPNLLSRRLGEAVIFPPDATLNAVHKQISPQAIKEKLPSVAPNVGNVRDGALATYAADYFALGQQGAVMVDKILKGVRPTDLPIEQPYKLNLVINMKTAKAIGLKISKEILIRADEVIE